MPVCMRTLRSISIHPTRPWAGSDRDEGTGLPTAVWIILLVWILLLQPAHGRLARQDPETARIRLLFLGWVVYPEDVTRHYQIDPLLKVTGVPLARRMVELGYITQDAAKRSARIYMPRTYERFLADSDVVFLGSMDVDLVTPIWNRWFRQSVVEEGVGLCMTGGWASYGGYSIQGYPPWSPTPVGEILPVECIIDRLSSEVVIRMDPVDREEPLNRALPWESAPPLFGINYVSSRGGSKVVANARGKLDEGSWPLLSYWDPGRGRVVCFMSSWLPSWGVEFIRWTYAPDFASYMVYFAAGVRLPASPELAHEFKRRIWLYREAVESLYKLVEFIEMMGVSASRISLDTQVSDSLYEQAQDLYRAQDYGAAADLAAEAVASIRRLESIAIKNKDRAFLWIYLVEWLSVTSVAAIAGTLLWTLMVRKATYRPVETTRSL